MKMTDGCKTINITMREWNGSGYGPDFSQDFFDGARYDHEICAINKSTNIRT